MFFGEREREMERERVGGGRSSKTVSERDIVEGYLCFSDLHSKTVCGYK